LNRITIIGNPHDTPENFEFGLKLAAEGKLKVLVDQVLPLSEAVHAHQLVEARGGIGKVLLDPTKMA
jgi:NADPH:quinone reductase-like Zn-dependent oxidoreductase